VPPCTLRVELARLLVGKVGELLDEVLVGLPEDVGLDLLVAQRQPVEVLNQVAEQRVGQPILARFRQGLLQRLVLGL
jgi:hypothetical protein